MRIVVEVFGDLVPDPDEREIERRVGLVVRMIGAEPGERRHHVVVWLPPLTEPAPAGSPQPGPVQPEPAASVQPQPDAGPRPGPSVPRQFRLCSGDQSVAGPSLPGGAMTDHPTDDACSGSCPGNDPCVQRPAWADRAHIRPGGAEFSSSLTVALPGEGAVMRATTLQVRQRVRLAVDGDDCVRVVRDAPVLHLPEIACTQEQVITLVDAVLRTVSAIPFPPVAGPATDAGATGQGPDGT